MRYRSSNCRSVNYLPSCVGDDRARLASGSARKGI
ncbi:hypothetical protein [Caulobacter vibrioides]|uniref:Uncharacterized protein n=1 Tax=Caulobacter vibrioides (strain NA1000 / CB15N) TaxID=565050 RepID=A0A0H3J1S3_CAUVN|nr:hypothetical protein [Caulobacter vibrioides]YP_009020559.1 hypothetical protein CCNA_03987 [Caulobacter vibrioides NA1000]QBQ57341.1 hypothetical protein EUX21_03130 [synthetic Caulobacter sp. 'ethensis']AHI88590.1 hypothetical protein CCNA_03987 [Caulobacter vibrioides NA1000]AVG21563.1 hypothetical protein CA608_20430 [Caulobacter vibrioides]AVH77103.1 hypothetical protein CA607_20590 [Caulobacter vibrioides]PLR16373.1 hypothetical protein CVUC_00700 [Caulobacter vibrioides]